MMTSNMKSMLVYFEYCRENLVQVYQGVEDNIILHPICLSIVGSCNFNWFNIVSSYLQPLSTKHVKHWH